MKNNTGISERILRMIDFLGVSKNDFANKLGYNRSQAIYDITSGKSKPSFDFFERLSNSEYSEIFSLDWIISEKGEMLKRNIKNLPPYETVTNTVTFSDETKSAENATLLAGESVSKTKMPAVVTVDKTGNDNVVLVPVKAAAGYLTGYSDPTFIQKLPTYNLPGINHGTFRMFQVKGHSMYPTLHDKSYVVGQWIENWVKEIKDNRIYVIVARSETDEGILVKRVLNRLKKYNNLYLKSDNRHEYPNVTLSPQDIIEVWEVKIYLGWELPDPANLYDKVYDLEAELEHIKRTLIGKKLK
ncbi:MAG: transcriptional regulator [Flavobacteriaceae bacterium]|jgi:phage repressor protein C with HTH and peptisase S24 domain|nr:transcriptional regulator [Flavobacteriaceae bacterium]